MTGSDNQARTDELKRALAAIRDLRRRVAELEGQTREPIAIVGMACRFPGGANTPERYWALLRDGVDATVDVPRERWDAEAFYDADPDAPGRIYVRRGGFLAEPVDRFDPTFFDISPREAAAMDPIHRMLLELAWEALERAGIPAQSLNDSDAGVFVGVSGSDYNQLQSRQPLEEIHSYRGTGSASCIASGRLSYFFGLHGPNVALDTACSSGLVALVQAVESLRAGRCGVALAGSAHLMLSPEAMVFLCRMRALSADGRCRTYSAAADGYGRGEGGAVLVLKRLKDALAAGDRVLAVIRGAASNHDGRSSGITVPNPRAQRALIGAALKDAGIDARDVSYVETHGTATPLGDPIELRALAEALGRDRPRDVPLLIGSVKTNFGHLEAAAGLAGVMKVALALEHEALPAHLHFDQPTAHVSWDSMPLGVVQSLTPWPRSAARKRFAGVSAFGFSGTNAHVILEEAPPAAADVRLRRPTELIALSGKSAAAVAELAGRYREALEARGDACLPDLAAAATAGRSHLNHRAYAIGRDQSEMDAALAAVQAASRPARRLRPADPPPLAFMFTGQGAQYPQMARELHSSAVFRDALERCALVADPLLGQSLLAVLESAADPALLKQTAIAQPALFAVEYALAQLWRSWGIVPDFVLGHSLGEYAAATVAGIMDVEDALRLVVRRGRLMQALPAGGRMAAVFGGEEAVREALEGCAGVAIAAFNGPENLVISGAAAGVAACLQRLAARGIESQDLEVSHAFHSPLMEPMLGDFAQALAQTRLQAPQVPIVSNVTGALFTDAEAMDAARWCRHVREPVRFAKSLLTLHEAGVRTFLEVGPHPTLTALGQSALREPEIRWLGSLRRGGAPWEQISKCVGELYVDGHDIDWRSFRSDCAGHRAGGPTYPFQRRSYWFAADAVREQPALQRMATHPLLGAVAAHENGWRFDVQLEPQRPAYLAEHRVGGEVLVPGAALLEMMLGAAYEGPAAKHVVLSNVGFEQPLVVPAEGIRCRVIVERPQQGRAGVRIESAAEGQWRTHATAHAAFEDAAPLDAVSLPALRESTPDTVDLADVFRRIAARGVEHGAAFRTLRQAWTGPAGAFAKAELSVDSASQAYRSVHPCLMDAGFQLLGALVRSDADDDTPFLPAGVDEVRTGSGAMIDTCWIHAALRTPGQRPDPDLLLADVRFFDARGQVALELRGFRARRRRAPASASAAPLEVAWRPVAPPAAPPDALPGQWLLLADEQGIAARLGEAVVRRGGRVITVRRGSEWVEHEGAFVIDAAHPEQLRKVLERVGTASLAGCFHCWALDEATSAEMDGEVIARAVNGALAPLVALWRADGCAGRVGAVHWMTRGAQGPDGTLSSDRWQSGAALWGMLSVLKAEYPDLAVRALDIDPFAPPPSGDELLQWSLGSSDEDRLAVRENALLAPRLEPLRNRTEHALQVPPAGAYRLQIERRGSIDGLRYAAVERAPPGPREVEVRIRCTGLNFRDVLNVLGMYPGDPGPPGVEFAGVVARCGSDVTSVSPGAAVIGIGGGTFAEYVTVPEHALGAAPSAMSFVEAATVPLAFLTAHYGLIELGRLAPGERVLIHAAAGGVGQAAVQIARARGAEIYATAGSDEKRNLLRAQGVRHVFDSRSAVFAEEIRAATGGEGIDVVLNSLTGEMLHASLALLRPGGRFLEMGKAEILEPAAVAAAHPGVEYRAFDLGEPLIGDPPLFQRMLRDLVERLERGELAPLPARTFAAEEVQSAFRFMAQARHVGKVVVTASRRPPSSGAIRSDGSYVVTGGGGGIGRRLVEWLIEKGAGAVTINGRSSPSPELEAWLTSLRSSGARVEWVRGDVSRAADAAALVERAQGSGLPLRGVFHAAGVLDDGLLAEQTPERFARVLAPKVAGAWNLHRATQRHDLDHFVLFSSVAALLGGQGQASYAAANEFLAGLAARRAREGLAGLAIDWGAWDDSGMAARMPERERRLLEQRGIRFLSARRGFSALEDLLLSTAHRAVVADIDWPRLAVEARRPVPLLRALGTDAAAKIRRPSATARLSGAELAALTTEQRERRVLEYVATALASVLGMEADEMTPDTEISGLGFDSLMAVELRNRLETEVGILVPTSRLLGSVTPADLAVELGRAMSAASRAPAAAMEAATTEGEI